MATTIDVLCKGHPEEFAKYMEYCRSLKFEDRPDAQFLRKLFKDLFYRMGFEHDYIFDWMMKKTTGGKVVKPTDAEEVPPEDGEERKEEEPPKDDPDQMDAE